MVSYVHNLNEFIRGTGLSSNEGQNFSRFRQKCYHIVMNNTQPLKGFRDFLPSEAEARNQVFDKVRTTFEQYGFLPLETPAMEYKEVLSGKYGKEGDKLMYQFQDQGGRDVALRYDLTVPLPRVIAPAPADLPIPFKRYQIAPAWRCVELPKVERLRA